MRILEKNFILTIVQTLFLVSQGFLSQHQTSPLNDLSSASLRTDQSFPSSLTIDQSHQHPSFRVPTNNVLVRHRRSVANVQTMGLFGLGGPEIAIILAVGAFVIGPQQLGSMFGSMTGSLKEEYRDLPDDLKKIPEEFQKGFEESTENAKARNAKPMEALPEEEKKE